MIQPDSLHPRTATELLEQILARDASPQSATTLQREQQDPAVRLGAATARYLDALHLAAEHLAGPQVVANLDGSAERLLNGLTGQPAWPTLRAHLMLLAAAGADPVAELFTAAALRDPMSAGDQAAVIDSRIQDINKRHRARAAAVAARHPGSHRQRPQLGTIPGRPITPGCSARRPGPQQRRR